MGNFTSILAMRTIRGAEDQGPLAKGRDEFSRLTAILIITFAFLSIFSLPASAVENLRFVHRAGQTFLTWREDTTREGELFRLYRSTTPFTSTSDLLPSRVIATLPENTSLYYTDLCRGMIGSELYKPLTRYVIQDLGKQLSAGIGLMVTTTSETGTYYYAITQVINNSEDKKIEPGTTTGPVNEVVANPQPVLVWKSPDGFSRIYTHWMDFQTWNKTFDAPRALNNYCGLSFQTPGMGRAFQYAYSYLVVFPRGYKFGGQKKYPLAVILHGFNERYVSQGERPVIQLVPDDPNSSWWFGFTEKTDYRTALPQQGPVVNFTELRLLEELRQVIALPDVRVDSKKIYAHGHSMGGTGALALGMRYPAIFSQVYAGQPQTNFHQAIPRFRGDLERKWGSQHLNLEVSNRGPDAVDLQRYDGTGAWDWQNFSREVLRRKTDDMSFIMVDHGAEDTNAILDTQGLPFYRALQFTKRSYHALVNSSSHSWQNFAARGYNGFSYSEGVYPDAEEAIIGFTSSSSTQSDPFYSKLFEWAGSVRRFGPLIVDTETSFEVTVRTNFKEMLVADITPRGTLNFHPRSKDKFRWRNRSLKSGMILQSGTVTAASLNMITIPRVQIEPTGNRIEIEE